MEILKSETDRQEKLKESNHLTLVQISTDRADIEARELALNAKMDLIRRGEEDNMATANGLIQRELAVKTSETKIDQERNTIDSLKAEHVGNLSKVNEAASQIDAKQKALDESQAKINRDREELDKLDSSLKEYAVSIGEDKAQNEAKVKELEIRETKLAQQESLNADVSKMFGEKTHEVKVLEDRLLAKQKDLDDREAGLKAQEEIVSSREGKLKAKAKVAA
jgi:chromosome segregation ATPase